MKSPLDLKKQAQDLLPQLLEGVQVLPVEQAARLIQDLRTHQIELEIQNEELRRAEIELITSRDRYRQLFDEAPVGYVVLDASAIIVEANESFCRLVGETREAVTRKSLSCFLAPLDSHSFLSRFRAWLAQPQGKSLEVWLLTAGGDMCRVQLGGESWADASGSQSERLLLSLTDVSDSYALSQEVEKVRAEHEALIETIPVGVFKYRMLKSGGGQFDYVSLRWCEQMGVERDAVLADAGVALFRVHSLELTALKAACEQARIRYEPFLWEGRFIVGGEERYLRISSSPARLANGDILWNGVQEDVTERKRTEARLADSLEEKNAILQSDLVGFVTLRGRVMTWMNSAFALKLDYATEELIGQPVRMLYPDEAAYRAVGEAAYPVISTGAVFRTQVQFRRKDGALNWFDISGARLHPDGEESIWAFVDIAAQKRSEAELVEARERAQQASRAKSRFLATMSHEIRTPMNSIFGMAQLLQLPGVADAERQDYAGAVLEAGQTLLALLDDILDLSKVEAGKVTLDQVLFEPAPQLEQIRTLYAQTAQGKGLFLRAAWSGPADAHYIGDPLRLRQMLSNLVSNAIKFTAHGQVRIEARERTRDAHGAVLEFAVTDTGIGVAPGKQALLFQPFTQADNSTTREYGGTGLGLSIVRNLAQLMGGEAGLDSQVGRGARFWFRVRVGLASVDAGAQQAPVCSAPAVGPAKLCGQVLVVEDHPANRKVVMALLGKLGVSVVLAEDGQRALDVITRVDRVDLVLMDVQMPIMDGYAATEQIRRWEFEHGRKRVPIVALTADAFGDDRARAREAGMDDFLAKPIALDALRRVLERWLRAADTPESRPTAERSVSSKPADSVAELVAELLPLLAQNRFDALPRFKALAERVAGTGLAAEIDAIASLVTAYQFDLARERLERLGSTSGW